MLEIIEYAKDEYTFPSLIVLGCFDAIHAGHRELFKKAKLQAKINGLDLGVMMFRDGKGGRQVYSFEERLAMLEAYNVKFVLVIDFTPEFKETSPADFLAAIEDKINVKAYMSGKDFRFGKGAKGKSSTLKNYAEDEENGVWYMPLKDVLMDGEKISTTLIKKCLDEGDVVKADKLLGQTFFVEGEVVEGAHRGAGVLGFPTINIKYPKWKYLVKRGVYKAEVIIDGEKYDGIANFGDCPTFDDSREALEVHIKDYSGDLYGKTVKVGFVAYMRDILKFDDAAALAAQLAQDKSALDLTEEQFALRYPLSGDQPAETVTEQPVEAAEEAVAEQPVEAAEEAVAEQPAEAAEEVVAEQPVEATEEVVAEQPVEVTEEVVEEQPVGATEVVVAEQPVEATEDVVAEQPVGATEVVVAEQPAEVTEEVVEKQPVEAAEDVVAEQPVEATEDVVAEQPVEVAEEAVAEQPVEVAEEAVAEQPVEAAEEVVEEQPVEAAEEVVAEQPVEATEEVVAEQPVEVAEEVVIEQPVEVTEEIVAEQPVEVTEEVADEESVEEGKEEEINEQPSLIEEKSVEVVRERDFTNFKKTKGNNHKKHGKGKKKR